MQKLTPEEIAEKLVNDWHNENKMHPLSWDFRGFAAEAVRRGMNAQRELYVMASKGFMDDPQGQVRQQLTAEMIREAEAHLPIDIKSNPGQRWQWYADYLNESLINPIWICPCCNVARNGEIMDHLNKPRVNVGALIRRVREKLLKLPTRIDLLGGQKYKYVRLEEVLAVLQNILTDSKAVPIDQQMRMEEKYADQFNALFQDALENNPYTNYSHVAQNHDVEKNRAVRYARFISERVYMRLLALTTFSESYEQTNT